MRRGFLLWAVALAALAAGAGCAARPATCQGAGGCPPGLACVTGRCEGAGGVPDLARSQRLVLDPVDVAFIERRGDLLPGSVTPVVTLGRRGEGEAALLLRFDVPAGLEVVRAWLVLDRAEGAGLEDDGASLHVERIAGPWDASSVTFVDGPPLADLGAPRLSVRGTATRRLRLDVTALLQSWRRRGDPCEGLAVLADRSTPTGVRLQALPRLSVSLPGDPTRAPPGEGSGPRLELYVK